MSTRSETPVDERSLLSESAYEFVDTDTESRDDNATESIASTDYSRPEDVSSLVDSEDSDDESEAGHIIPSFHGLDGPNATPTIGRSVSMDEREGKRLSIEFEEPLILETDTISVRHTIADFNEQQTADIVRNMNLRKAPGHLVATIHQTMSKHGLSTREPLRILYVGSHAAKQDVIHKIATAVSVSVTDIQAQSSRSTSSQVYNVVPVSAFGSETAPEVELMHSSGIQISVEDCVTATNLKFEDEPDKPDVIKLTLDDNFSYHSVPDVGGYIVEPEWVPPNIAIIYCSESDSVEIKRTRMLVRSFMNRHGIPSIVISHKLSFEKPAPTMMLNVDALHICLESRDPNGGGTLVHQRLPIDLASFLNIDARQMNRNLAYLTGNTSEKLETSEKIVRGSPKSSMVLPDSKSRFAWLTTEWRSLVPFVMMLLSILLALATGFVNVSPASVPAVSINGNLSSTVPKGTEHTSLLPSVVASSLSTLTSTSTATRTVTITEATSSGPNSLSVVPLKEVSKLPATMQSQPAQNKSTSCSAEIIGDREILIRIPYSTKSSWLSKEAISLNITRGNATVEAERVYSSDEGILLQFSRKEAYGLFNISVVTTRKPRINETVTVNFGMNWQVNMEHALSWLSTQVHDHLQPIPSWAGETYLSAASQFYDWIETAQDFEKEADLHPLDRLRELYNSARDHASSAPSDIFDAAKATSFGLTKNAARISKEISIHCATAWETIEETLALVPQTQEPLKATLLRAQVQARLYWLKLQGKETEYNAYQERATKGIQEKLKEMVLGQKGNKASKKAAKKAKKAKKHGRRH